jgi:hypothetical protein
MLGSCPTDVHSPVRPPLRYHRASRSKLVGNRTLRARHARLCPFKLHDSTRNFALPRWRRRRRNEHDVDDHWKRSLPAEEEGPSGQHLDGDLGYRRSERRTFGRYPLGLVGLEECFHASGELFFPFTFLFFPISPPSFDFSSSLKASTAKLTQLHFVPAGPPPASLPRLRSQADQLHPPRVCEAQGKRP